MPENWNTYKLGEVAVLRKKTIRPKDFNGEKYIGLEHIGQGDFLLNGIGIANDVTSNKFKFKSGDILYGKIRPYFRKVHKPQFSGICSADILIIKSSSEEIVTQEYLYQLIKTQTFTDKAVETSSGTKMPRADWNSLEQVELTFPPLREQKSIASVLSAIDDKIELNLQMNKTLEEMAMALYKHWFVDFGPFQDGEFVDSELGEIPKGWEVNRLDSILEIKYGKDHKKLEDGIIPVYGTGGIMRYVNQSLYDQEAILIPRKGSLNNLYHINEPFWTVDTLFYSKIKQRGFGKYVFHFLKTLDLASMDVGSAVPSLTTQLLNRIEILIPPNIEVLKYEESANIWFNAIQSNIQENKTLTHLRDTLLPKLISGEVRVKDAEKTLTEAL